jgi:hypothetical protein
MDGTVLSSRPVATGPAVASIAQSAPSPNAAASYSQVATRVNEAGPSAQQPRQLVLGLIVGLVAATVIVVAGLTIYFIISRSSKAQQVTDGVGSVNSNDYDTTPGAATGSHHEGNWTPSSSAGLHKAAPPSEPLMPPAWPVPMHPDNMQNLRVVALPHMAPKLPAQPATATLAEPSLSLTGSNVPLMLAGGADSLGNQERAHMPPVNCVGLPY